LSPLTRRHGPRGYADHDSFRPWLRDEFSFRCVYCLQREWWVQFRAAYHLDHFLPIAQHPEHAVRYDNLLYSCSSCNSLKGAQLLPDPVLVFVREALRVSADGTIEATTAEAARIVLLLDLDSPDTRKFRRQWIGITALASQHDPDLYQQLMGFPDDLPDLNRLQPPEGNAKPEGIEESHFARRQRGELPATY